MDVSTLRKRLECPVCMEVRQGTRMFGCQTGHTICAPCYEDPSVGKANKCPVCKGRYRDKKAKHVPPPRNLMVESLIEDCETIESPCKNSWRGCGVRGIKGPILAHQVVCAHRKVPCPDTCDDSRNLQFSDVLDHMKTKHDATTSSCKDTRLILNHLQSVDAQWESTIREVDGLQFILCFKNVNSVFLAWVVVVAADKAVAEDYKVIIEASGNDCLVRMPCKVHPVDRAQKDILADKDIFKLELEMVEKCRIENPVTSVRETSPFSLLINHNICKRGGPKRKMEELEAGSKVSRSKQEAA